MLTTEQQTIRMRGIGGSDIAAILGLDPYRGPWDVWADKTGRAEPFLGNEHTRWGERMEDVIADAYRERMSVHLSPGMTVVHPRLSFVVGTPDRIVWLDPTTPAGLGLEIKNKSPRQAWRWGAEAEGASGVPDEVQAQTAWYLALTGYERWDVAAYFGGADFRVYQLTRDLEVEAAMLDVGARFWRDHVEADKPPAFDGAAAAWTYLRDRFAGVDKGKLIDPPAGAHDLAAAIERAKQDRDDAEQREQAARQMLADLAAGLSVRGFACDDWRYTIGEQRGRVNFKTLATVLAERAQLSADELAKISEACRGKAFIAPRFTSKKTKGDE